MILNIADKIRLLREQRGLTQTDLAKTLGISRSAVNSWEMSLSLPSLTNIVELAKIFHVSTDFLLSVSDKFLLDITDLSSDEKEIVTKMVACFLKKRK